MEQDQFIPNANISYQDEIRAIRNAKRRTRFADMPEHSKQVLRAKDRQRKRKSIKGNCSNLDNDMIDLTNNHLQDSVPVTYKDRFIHLQNIPQQAELLPQVPNCQYCDAKRFYKELPGFCCMSGQVALDLPRMPLDLWDLYTNQTCSLAKHFRQRCRTYNNTTAFTTLRMKCDRELSKAKQGFYTVKVNGSVYHQIPDLIPQDGFAKQLQLFFYGTENELQNRLSQSGDLEAEAVTRIMNIMKVNPYATFFRSLTEIPTIEEQHIVLRSDPTLDERVYNLPVTDHVAAIWHQLDDVSTKRPHDIRVYTHSDRTHYIQYYYGCYDPLQYPLLFPYGEPGWHAGIAKLPMGGATNSIGEALTCNGQNAISAEYQQTTEQLLTNESNSRLAQQFQIDTYVKMETQRLDFLRDKDNQHVARMETYRGIVDSMASEGIQQGSGLGKRVILPAKFIGGPRDMHDRYMNALALVQKYGKPDFFITMTCNQNWPEIQDELLPGEEARNRGDLLTRVFRAKNERLKEELVTKKIVGEVAAYFYVIEFQKRGMPHAHWLIVLTKKYKLTSAEAYDRFVSAEIPDEDENPHLHSCVAKHMVHGPCGKLNEKNVCMKKQICSKKYPKEYVDVTTHRENAYPAYRRREDGKKLYVRKHWLDNRWIVPYNPYLLALFDCHLNVEICSDIKLIKYLYKYVCKGHDKISYSVVENSPAETVDEIKNFQSARWLCAPEAMWRIYGFLLNEMQPSVTKLHVHLPDLHPVWFSGGKTVAEILQNENAGKTQLTEFFRLNATNPEVQSLGLLYHEFPEHFVWNKTEKTWTARQRGIMLGRMVNVSPVEGERYFLRVLLKNVKSPTSFEYLKDVNEVKCATFREAALERGLLQSDTDIRDSMAEAAAYQMPYPMRQFFATILIFNSPSDPKALWEEFRRYLADDFLKDGETEEHIAFLKALQGINTFLQSNGRSVDEFNLVSFKVGTTDEVYAMEYEHERTIQVSAEDLASITRLNEKQKQAFDDITSTLNTNGGGFFFIDGPGGTGKTYLYRALLASIRSKGEIALAVATSGVAASLLPGGRTAHSRFKLPIVIEDSMTCMISKQSVHAHLLVAAKIIIWDEASMAHRRHVETLDMLLRDLTGKNIMFGGKTIVLGGDFRQTIPIVVGGTKSAEIDACLVRSELWRYVKKISLTENMRAREDPVFMDFLMHIGNGTQPLVSNQNIRLPTHMCISPNTRDPLNELISFVFPTFDTYFTDPFSVMDRAILTPKNECVRKINDMLIMRFTGEETEYFSTDLTEDPTQQGYYQDFLNSVDIPELPPHVLRLKVNCPVMMIRNINPSQGQCNGTRLIIRELGKNIIRAQIASGEHKGNDVLIPRIPLQPSESLKCPIPFKRHQFPIKVCFAMTINKAQGQTLERTGIYLPEPVFSHGQLYVGLSRAKKSEAVKVFIRPATVDSPIRCETRNIVYTEILEATSSTEGGESSQI